MLRPSGLAALRLRMAEWLEKKFEAERGQLPLWLPVAFGFGIASWFWLPDIQAWIAFLLLASAVVFLSFSYARETRVGRAAAIFGLAATLGMALIWWRAESLASLRLERPMVTSFSAHIKNVERLPARQSIRLIVTPIGRQDLPERLRLTVDEKKEAVQLTTGTQMGVRARLMPPSPMAVPGAYDFARAAWFARIGGVGTVLDLKVEQRPHPGMIAHFADLRQRLSDHVHSRVGGPEGGLAATLVTGDRGGIAEDDAEAMRQSGLAHLLSISGLHVTAVVGAAIFLTLKLLVLSPALALRYRLVLIASGVGALAALGYTLLTGAEVPTIRACIAALLVLVGVAMGRDALTLRLVAVGALVVMLLWPESISGPSFQLSFAAITAIIALHEHPRIIALLSRREESVLARIGRMLLGLLLTGLVVEIALTPIALYHFNKAGIYGAAANIIAIPLTTFVIMPSEAIALLLDLAGFGAPFWWIARESIALLLTIAHAAANAPGAVTTLPTMGTGAFALLVCGGIWICLWWTSWRWWGFAPLLAGAFLAITTPPPDLLITGDGRHVGVRTSSGGLAILRPRAGDYVKDMLSETAGLDVDAVPLDVLPNAACSADFCAVNIERNGYVWRVLATRTPYLVEFGALERACANADIVISDRKLPRTCSPRWLKADRAMLAKSGGMVISLAAAPEVTTVAQQIGQHPWAFRTPPARQ